MRSRITCPCCARSAWWRRNIVPAGISAPTKAAEAKPTRTLEDAQARLRAAELAEPRANALAAADSLGSGGAHAAGIIAYAVTRSVERSSEIARAKLKAKLAPRR